MIQLSNPKAAKFKNTKSLKLTLPGIDRKYEQKIDENE